MYVFAYHVGSSTRTPSPSFKVSVDASSWRTLIFLDGRATGGSDSARFGSERNRSGEVVGGEEQLMASHQRGEGFRWGMEGSYSVRCVFSPLVKAGAHVKLSLIQSITTVTFLKDFFFFSSSFSLKSLHSCFPCRAAPDPPKSKTSFVEITQKSRYPTPSLTTVSISVFCVWVFGGSYPSDKTSSGLDQPQYEMASISG